MTVIVRPGVFIGRRYNTTSAYIIDPAVEHPAAVESQWRDRFASTNSSIARRLGAGLAALVGFAVVFIGGIILLVALLPTQARTLSPLVIGMGCVALVLGLVVGAFVLIWLWPSGEASGDPVYGVEPVDESVAAWDSGALSVAEVWELNTALQRVRQVHNTLRLWADWHDDVFGEPHPNWVIESVIEPVMLAELEKQRTALRLVARRFNFEVPEYLFEQPEPLSHYSDR
jgi:hypothetical protein